MLIAGFPPEVRRGEPRARTRVPASSHLPFLPLQVPIYTVNRQCAGGLQAIADIAAAIKAGYITVGIAGDP